jgi:hypothetical protein
MERIILDLDTKTKRQPWRWTKLKEARASDVLGIAYALQEYWPVTERQLYYRLISSNLINQDHWHKDGDPSKEKPDVYNALSPLLKWMRIDEILPWDVITDEHRILTPKPGFTDIEAFVDQELQYFLEGYEKCLAQKQEHYIEVWIEKAALYRIVEPIVSKYCRRLVVCKGYNSVTFQADFYRRAQEALNLGQKPVVLYFGDWDPSGTNMIYAAVQTLEDELGLVEVDYWRCGINPKHFDSIPADPVPIKPSDKRSKRFIELYGKTCYELDAFHPRDLQTIVEDSILTFTNVDVAVELQKQEGQDRIKLAGVKQQIVPIIKEYINGKRMIRTKFKNI